MTAAEAKAHLSTLLDRAASGEETIITRRGKVVAKLGPAEAPVLTKRVPGALKGQLKYDDATLWAPMTDAELDEIEGNIDALLPVPAAPGPGKAGKRATPRQRKRA